MFVNMKLHSHEDDGGVADDELGERRSEEELTEGMMTAERDNRRLSDETASR
jgi:hypothetical protein